MRGSPCGKAAAGQIYGVRLWEGRRVAGANDSAWRSQVVGGNRRDFKERLTVHA
jgi:hypothetical protein